MKLRVQYTAQLRTAVGCNEEEVELREARSVSDLLAHLASERGDHVRTHLLGDGGQVRPSLMVVVNGAAVPADQTDDVRLNPGDVVILLPPIAGG
jgi:MoaD family protein